MATSSYFYHYFFIGIFVLFSLAFPLLPIILAYFVAPKKPSESKNASYECGLESKGEAWIQFRIQYYLYALIFVIFDIETIFIYPWAVAFKHLGIFAFIEMILFIAILAAGLVYAWRKNILEWEA
ncbi:MAG: NADH-quinone oxidoreductase subunit A [Candidatus Omnitrophica bacterium]|nr:NADH-quinone oxidoreductase subunit A [Candidatus Omnitrophota bacterium]